MTVWEITKSFMVAAFLFWTGAMLLAGAFGLLPAMKSDTPVLAFLVAVPFALVMISIATGMCLEPIRASGINKGISRTRLAGRLLLRLMLRPRFRSLLSAIPLAVLAAQYIRHKDGFLLSIPGVSETVLISTLRIEFLLIHGFPFLAMAALPIVSKERAVSAASVLLFLLLLFFYAGAAMNVAGSIYGALMFAYLMLPDVGAFAGKETADSVRPRLAMRWALYFLAMLSVLVITQTKFLQNAATFNAGAAFFTIMALVELFRLADIPLEIARRLFPFERPPK